MGRLIQKKRQGVQPAVFLPALVALSLLRVDPAMAAAKQFIPRYEEFLADFGIQGIYERDRLSSGSGTRTSQDLLLQEGFSTKGFGYIYSPLFISMETSIGLGLQQETIDNNGKKESYYDGNANQFKQRFKILPTHPYNLELYFLRATPMTAGNAGSSGSTVFYEHGARALYDERPWSTSLTYTNRDTESTSSSEHETILYSLSYYLSDFNVSGTYGHTTSTRYDGQSDTVRDQYNLGLSKSFEKIRFYSNWTLDEEDEKESLVDEPDSSFLIRQEQFFSELQFDLPYNFDSSLTYNKSSMESDFNVGERDSSTATDSDRYGFKLHHRLFKSLSSTFTAGYQTTDATGGEMEQENYRLGVDYTKKIPWGSVLAGIWNGLAYADNQGAPISLFQPHTLNATSFFNIRYQAQLIDRDTITVYLIDDNTRYMLTEGLHYAVSLHLNEYRVTILSLPDDDQGNPRNIDDLDSDGNRVWRNYQVDFTFVAADYELENKNWGASLQAPLFDDLITPHYAYTQNDQQVLAGYYPGEPTHSKNHSLGLGFNREPFRGDVTMSWLRSNVTDEDRIMSYIGYSRDITTRTTGFLSLSFEDVQSTQYDLTGNDPAIDLSEQFYTIQAQLQTVLPEKNLNASLSSNYTLYQGVGESTILSFFSTLVWHVGKLDFNISASYTTSESAVSDSNTSRDYAMVRFMIKRKLL